MLLRERRGLSFEALAVSRIDSDGGSSNGSSPNILTDSGTFHIGKFAIGRDGVVERPEPCIEEELLAADAEAPARGAGAEIFTSSGS